MPNYQNSKIYTIRCKADETLIYVGSTTQLLSKRMVEHRSKHNKDYSDNYSKPLYIKMREIGIDNFYIELYEDFPCERKEQLEKYEGEIIRNIGTLNRVVAGVQYRKNTSDYNKTYWTTNKTEMKEKNKLYRQEHKEEIKEHNKRLAAPAAWWGGFGTCARGGSPAQLPPRLRTWIRETSSHGDSA